MFHCNLSQLLVATKICKSLCRTCGEIQLLYGGLASQVSCIVGSHVSGIERTHVSWDCLWLQRFLVSKLSHVSKSIRCSSVHHLTAEKSTSTILVWLVRSLWYCRSAVRLQDRSYQDLANSNCNLRTKRTVHRRATGQSLWHKLVRWIKTLQNNIPAAARLLLSWSAFKPPFKKFAQSRVLSAEVWGCVACVLFQVEGVDQRVCI